MKMPAQHTIVYDNKGSDELIVRYMNLIFHFHPDGKIVISETHNEGYASWILFDGDELDLRNLLSVQQPPQGEG
jgi:ArsR family metal-binding transcriptional regulator